MIITGVEHCGDIIALLGSGAEHGCSFTYRVQDQPDIAGALRLCEDFVGNDKCVVLLGDNIFKENLTQHINAFQDSDMVAEYFLNMSITHQDMVLVFSIKTALLKLKKA